MILLDTDLISILQRKDSTNAVRLLSLIDLAQVREKVVTTIISYEEQMRGWLAVMARARTLHDQIAAYLRLRNHAEYYASRTLIDFDAAAAIEFQRLKGLKVRIGTMDLKIAAIVVARSAALWTRNISDFQQVPDLAISNPLE